MLCFKSLREIYIVVIKRRMFPFFRFQLSLIQFTVSYVHRPLKVEKISAEYIEGVAALVLCDFYQSISFIDELPISKQRIPTYEYNIVQYYLRALLKYAENREIERKKFCLRVRFARVLLFLAHTDQ